MSNMNYERELKQAISFLYKTFAPYPLNSKIEACPCCVTEKENKLLLSKPLDKLAADDLNRYAFKAITTWGTIEDFKHFLPRSLELAALDRKFFWSDGVFRKLLYAEFHNWQEQEKEAVCQYIVVFWRYILSEYDYPPLRPNEIIGDLVALTNNLEVLLLSWQNHTSINSFLHLSDFIRHEIYFYNSPIEIIYPIKIINLSEHNTEIFLDWLVKSKVVNKLEKTFFNNIDKSYAENLAIAVDIINCAINSLATSVEDI